MYSKFLYSRRLEQKTYVDHFLKFLIPISNYKVVCFFQSNTEEAGEYEVYDIRKTAPIVKKQMKEIIIMNEPFEYSDREIGFFNNDTLSLWILDFMDSKITNTEITLPSQRLSNFFTPEFLNINSVVYVDQCLRFKYFQGIQSFVTLEQFHVFASEDATCNENNFISWNVVENKKIDECQINESNYLIFEELQKQKIILICKQVYMDEDFTFSLWIPGINHYKFINVKQSLNATIIKPFDNQNKIIIKEEQPDASFISKRILIIANPNHQAHPILINVECDQDLNLKDFNYAPYQIDSKGCILIESPWLIGNDLIVSYYTHTNITIAVCDINKQLEPFKLINFKQEQKVSNFYFSQSPKHFIELYDDATKNKVEEEIILPNQTQEITQYYHHSFVPNQIHFFHYLISKGIYNQIGDLCMEVMQFAFSSPIKKEKVEQQN
ncbi:unnamed protein product [Paramecium sonneborni]|uniref:Uncharacterized protein n=1 Tax=Paramecium sonneborni TaxID=65129 RepID=A0A8S1KZW6_9CILI|nr:unnamed protein product [Paramecium sonneborni]